MMRIKVKPFEAKYCSRSLANEINDMFASIRKPDRTQLAAEAARYKAMVLARRSSGLGNQ